LAAAAAAGLADPAPVLQTFFVDDDLQEAFQLDALITVVDAKHIMQHLDEEKPEGVENESGARSCCSTINMLDAVQLGSALLELQSCAVVLQRTPLLSRQTSKELWGTMLEHQQCCCNLRVVM
jgi:G3E family GTPase